MRQPICKGWLIRWRQWGGGGRICIPAGEFPFNAPIEIIGGNAITISGCGPATILNPGFSGALFRIRDSTDIKLKDFSAQNEVGDLIDIIDSKRVEVNDCDLSCESGIAVMIAGADNEELTIRDCRITANVGVRFNTGHGILGFSLLNSQVYMFSYGVRVREGEQFNEVRIEGNKFEAIEPIDNNDLTATAVRVGTMGSASRLIINDNQIGLANDAILRGIIIATIGENAKVYINRNKVRTFEDILTVSTLNSEVHINVMDNELTSTSENRETPVISIGGTTDSHAIQICKNQILSSQNVIDGESVIFISTARAIVNSNYIVNDASSQSGFSNFFSIRLAPSLVAAVINDNLTQSGVNISDQGDSNIIVSNNARIP